MIHEFAAEKLMQSFFMFKLTGMTVPKTYCTRDKWFPPAEKATHFHPKNKFRMLREVAYEFPLRLSMPFHI